MWLLELIYVSATCVQWPEDPLKLRTFYPFSEVFKEDLHILFSQEDKKMAIYVLRTQNFNIAERTSSQFRVSITNLARIRSR